MIGCRSLGHRRRKLRGNEFPFVTAFRDSMMNASLGAAIALDGDVDVDVDVDVGQGRAWASTPIATICSGERNPPSSAEK